MLQRDLQVLRRRLEELLNKTQELNTPAAREAAQRNQQLIQRIEQIEAQQQQLETAAEKMEAVKNAKDPLNELAKEQKKLNDAISELAKKDQKELRDAGAQAPNEPQLAETVRALNDLNRAPEAVQRQMQIAEQLKTDAKQLEKAADAKKSPLADKTKADQLDQERAKAEQKKADEIAKTIEKANELAKSDKPDEKNKADQAKEQVKAAETQLANETGASLRGFSVPQPPADPTPLKQRQQRLRSWLQT